VHERRHALLCPHGDTREGRIAVRSALGASRTRIIAQLFVEAFVLASLAAAPACWPPTAR
jgi:hypothetical protein